MMHFAFLQWFIHEDLRTELDDGKGWTAEQTSLLTVAGTIFKLVFRRVYSICLRCSETEVCGLNLFFFQGGGLISDWLDWSSHVHLRSISDRAFLRSTLLKVPFPTTTHHILCIPIPANRTTTTATMFPPSLLLVCVLALITPSFSATSEIPDSYPNPYPNPHSYSHVPQSVSKPYRNGDSNPRTTSPSASPTSMANKTGLRTTASSAAPPQSTSAAAPPTTKRTLNQRSTPAARSTRLTRTPRANMASSVSTRTRACISASI